MPRIVPLQLLKCLRVLLDENGGILSGSEVKRIAGLMTKYSKKLVSKCIFVQILKCTKTELLGEFMAAGGWNLTHNWLNDAIRAKNWPLVLEILELLLLCPVDVERLKSNSAPKLVKGLCKDGDDEGVRILASKLVEQWLKVVTGDAIATKTTQMAPKAGESTPTTNPVNAKSSDSVMKKEMSFVEEDPLGETEPPIAGTFQPTLAQKKASESGLVLKCIIKDGKQVWARVENTAKNSAKTDDAVTENKDIAEQDEEEEGIEEQEEEEINEEEKIENESEVNELSEKSLKELKKPDEELTTTVKSSSDTTDNKENEVSLKKKEVTVEKEKSKEKEKEREKEKDKEKDKDKEKEKEKSKSSSSSDKDRKSSSSSHKSSSSSHKSSSSSSSKSSSSSSKSKSSHRNSTDSKSRDKDKEREKEKDKDKERSSNKERSSDKDKHRSSSSKSASSSSSSSSKDKDKDRHRDKSSSSSSSSIKKDKEKEKSDQGGPSEKEKESASKPSISSIDRLGKIPKKPKDDTQEIKPTSITIPSKKASMSIEIRRDSEKAKTVKTYKSQFRSHGLNEEAPPPPSRKGLKKPNSASVPGTAIPNTLNLKRPSPPPTLVSSLNKDAPSEKKAKIEMAALAAPVVEKIGAIKLIPPKKSFICLCELAVVLLFAYNSAAKHRMEMMIIMLQKLVRG